MKVIDQYWQFENKPTNVYELLENAGRTCWKSEDKKKEGSAEDLIKKLIRMGHTSVLEHANVTVRIITDRGVTHELVRHRLASYSQESTRYCNYTQNKFDNQITFIRPVWSLIYQESYNENPVATSLSESVWIADCLKSEEHYNKLIHYDWPPQKARQVLNHSVKTEIVVTANMREWRHIFNLRASNAAHPQIRDLARNMLSVFCLEWPVLFNDIKIGE